uniref:Caspase 1 n=1 Tax=Equus asinus TaxID=9793 RepID=A0A9L0KC95_EQUAS
MAGNVLKEKRRLFIRSVGTALQAMPDDLAKLALSGPKGSLKLCSPEVVERIWKEKSAEMYPIMGKSMTRTRLALIICNTEFDDLSRRAGAEVDIASMKVLLEGLGYSVEVKENLTALDMTTELKAFAARPEHRSSDSTFLVFMSHGIREGICGKKFSEKVPDVLEVNTIFQIFNTRNCPNLRDKPKVIIIQACRGDTVSWRSPTTGSVFIEKLIENLQEYAWSCDLEEIFRKVRLSFELPDARAQMPTAERVTLTRRFYLFPGY